MDRKIQRTVLKLILAEATKEGADGIAGAVSDLVTALSVLMAGLSPEARKRVVFEVHAAGERATQAFEEFRAEGGTDA